MSQYVDNMATSSLRENMTSVRDSLGYVPRPPSAKPDTQGPGVDISISLGNDEKNQQAAASRNYRCVSLYSTL